MEIREGMPLSYAMTERKAHFDRVVSDVMKGASDKLLVVIGPCSADREDAVLEYATRLAALQERVADRLVLVPRASCAR